MTNHEQPRALAEKATPEMKEWFNLDEQGWCYAGEAYDAQAYIASASPDVVLALLDELFFYKRRVELLQEWQSKMRDPERTICCDIIANGQTLPPANAGTRYAVPQAEIDALRTLITKLHAAKGRYHSQQACCDLFDAVGLKNERPVK